MTDEDSSLRLPDTDQAKPTPSPSGATKTPMFSAANSARYHRQTIMRSLDDKLGTKLVCYVGGKHTEISRDDTLGMVDLLHNIAPGGPVDLLLHTGGGDIDAAEKLILLIHAKVGDQGSFRVIVPDYAKSAGTLMAVGANEIIMSDTSELGTIDPQFCLKDGRGNDIPHSVLSYLDAYKEHSDALQKNRDDPVAMLMLDKFDPNIVQKFQSIRDRARTMAENLLKRRGAPSSSIAAELMDIARWKSHGQMINHADAKQIGLNISYLPMSDPTWSKYWELYCLQRLEIGDDKKIFESSYVSQVFAN